MTTFFGGRSNQWHTAGFYNIAEGLIGREVTLDIIDAHYGDWGWIGVDDFQMIGALPWDVGGTYTLTVVPEPATMSLLALGGVALLRRRRK